MAHFFQTNGQMLRQAAYEGNLARVQRYAQRPSTNVNARGVLGETPLHRACVNGHIGVAQYLLNRGANVNAQDLNGDTPVHFVCRYGHPDLLQLLLAGNPDLSLMNDRCQNALDVAEETPNNICYQILDLENPTEILAACLMVAAESSQHLDRDDIRRLLAKGVQVHKAFGENNLTLLHLACHTGSVETVEEILGKCTCKRLLRQRDSCQRTPLHIACKAGNVSMIRLLLKRGARLHDTDEDGWGPLHFASTQENTLAVQVLLDTGNVDVKLADFMGNTALHLAAAHGHKETASLLIDRGLRPDVKNHGGYTPLHQALDKGKDDTVRLLLERGASVHVQNNDGVSPLCLSNNSRVCALILDKGAVVNSIDMEKRTPLMYACTEPTHEDVAALLLSRGAQIHMVDNDGWTALHYAARCNDPGITQLLLRNGASIDMVEGKSQSTPLHQACSSGSLDAAKVLISNGASVKLRCGHAHMTALHVAARGGHADIVKLLLNAGSKVDETDHDKYTPLHFAAIQGDEDCVRHLLTFGANPDAVEEKQITALHFASRSGHLSVAKVLLENGAHASCTKTDGWTPLHLAVGNGHLDVVRLLLEYFANTSLRNNDGQTPLDVAQQENEEEIIQLLNTSETDKASQSVFFEMLDDIVQNSNEPFGFSGKLNSLPSLVRNMHEMKILYTLVGSCLRGEIVSQGHASHLIKIGLDTASRTCKSEAAYFIFLKIIQKALDDLHVTQQDYDVLKHRALLNRIENAPFILEIWDAIRENSHRISCIDNKTENLVKSFNALQDSIRQIRTQVGDITAYLQYQRRVNFVVGLIDAVAGALTFGIGGQLATAMQVITENIVDFADIHHIEAVILDFDAASGEDMAENLIENFCRGVQAIGNMRENEKLDELISNGNLITRLGVIAAIDALEARGSVPDKNSVTTTTTRTDDDSSDVTIITDDEDPPITGNAIYGDALLSEADELAHPLHAAVIYGYMEDIEAAVGEDPSELSALDSMGRNAIDLAVLSGQITVAKFLRQKGGKYEKTKAKANFILKERAARSSEFVAANRSLLDLILYEDEDLDPDTHPLHVAVKNSELEDVEEVLEEEPGSLNKLDAHGRTPLDMAVLLGQEKIAEYLVEHGGQNKMLGKWTMKALLRGRIS